MNRQASRCHQAELGQQCYSMARAMLPILDVCCSSGILVASGWPARLSDDVLSQLLGAEGLRHAAVPCLEGHVSRHGSSRHSVPRYSVVA